MSYTLENLARSGNPLALVGEVRAPVSALRMLANPRFYRKYKSARPQIVMFIPGSFNTEYPGDICGGWILADRLKADGHTLVPTGFLINSAVNRADIYSHYWIVRRSIRRAANPEQRINLIGHSLGGVFAKLLASDPALQTEGQCLVKRIITLGFSVNDPTPKKYLDREALQVLQSPLPAGIEWLAINTPEDPLMAYPSENRPDKVQKFVRGSHGGLVTNWEAITHIRRTLR